MLNAFCRHKNTMHLIVTVLYLLSARVSAADDKPMRWSRQISNAEFLNDWIPVQPRQSSGRVLNFGPPFAHPQTSGGIETPLFLRNQELPSANHVGELQQQLYFPQMTVQNTPLMTVQNVPVQQPPQAPHFLFRPPHADIPNLNYQFTQQFPPPAQPQLVIPQHHQQLPQSQPLVRNEPQQQHEQQQQLQQQHQQQQQQLQQQQQKQQQQQLHQQHQQQQQQLQQQQQQQQPQDEVQLLYVPLDTLQQHHHQQQSQQLQNTRYNVLPSPVNPAQINNNLFASQHQHLPQQPLQQPIYPPTTTVPAPRLTTRTTPRYRPNTPSSYHRFSSPVTEAIDVTTRPKPHQPPLAMFMKSAYGSASKLSVNDVLSTLVKAQSIDVLDSAGKTSPQIFVGPSGLKTPDGYSKFELPYLSTIEQTRSERQIGTLPFFVAPLSYRTPNGFAKIPLPAPHVGSVVVNAHMNSVNNDEGDRNYPEKTFYSSLPKKQPVQGQYLTVPPPASTADRFVKPTTINRFRFGADYFARTTPQSPAHRPEAAAVISSTPSYNENLDAYNSYRTTPSYRRPSTESALDHSKEQISQFAHSTFAPFPTYTKEQPSTFDHFAKVHSQPESTYQTDAPTAVTTAYDEGAFRHTYSGPSKYVLSNTQNLLNNSDLSNHSPDVETYTQYYTSSTPKDSYYSTPEPNVATTKKSVYDFGFDRYQSNKPFASQTSPTASTTTSTTTSTSPATDTPYRTKSHYREREQQQLVSKAPTPHTSYIENASIQPTQNEQDYNNEPYSTVPTQLTNYNKEPVFFNRNHNQNNNNNLPSSTPKTTFTYYTATAAQEEADIPRTRAPYTHQFKFVDSVLDSTVKPAKEPEVSKYEALSNQGIFNRQNEYSKLSYNEISSTASPQTRVFDTSTSSPTHSYREYQVTPSSNADQSSFFDLLTEPPRITSNLPGLVNSLMDGGNNGSSTLTIATTTPATVQITTRRSTLARGRRPQLPTRSSYATETPTTTRSPTTRRVINRGRRPIASTPVDPNRASTLRTSTPVERNTSRVRYSPTADERQRKRNRMRASTTSRPSRDEENIDYQRDVLKQNYPNFGRTDAIPSSTPESAAISTFDDLSANRLKTNNEQLEPQQQSNEADVESAPADVVVNEPTFYNSRESLKLNAKPENGEITTEAPAFLVDNNQSEITKVLRTRKPTVIRRPLRTSTQRPITTTVANEAVRSKVRNTGRPKSWYESNTRAAAKPLYRERRPFTSFSQRTTTTPPAESSNHKYTQGEESERETSAENVSAEQNPTEKKKYPYRFSLSAEETQWSTKLNSNSFQPVDSSSEEKQPLPPSDVDIVTASSVSDADDKESYTFNVESKNIFGPSKAAEEALDAPVNTPSATLNDIIPATLPATSANENGIKSEKQLSEPVQEESRRSSLGKDAKGKRRGVWKRVRVRPVDSFEAAESQNIGKQLYNSLLNDNEEFGTRFNKRVKDFGEKTVSYPEQESSDDIEDEVREVPTTFASFITPVNEDQTSVATESSNDEVVATTLFDNTEATTIAPETTTITSSVWNLDEDEKDNFTELTTESNEKNTIIPTEISSKGESSDNDDEPTSESFTTSPFDAKNYTEDDDATVTRSEQDQEPQPSSVIDEVKKRLTELFSFEDDDVVVSTTERVFRINRNFNRQKPNVPSYTTIDRNHAVNEIMSERNKDAEKDEKPFVSPATMKLEPVTMLKTILRPVTEASSFHKDLMDSVIYATSTSTEISHETEICYRGRCVKTHKKP